VRLRGAERTTLALIDGMGDDPFFGELTSLCSLRRWRARKRRPAKCAAWPDAVSASSITSRRTARCAWWRYASSGLPGTKEASARYAGFRPVDYALSAGFADTEGFPPGASARDLGAQNGAASGRFEYAPTDTFRLKAVARYSRTEADGNDQDFNFPPGPTFGFVIDSDDYYRNEAFYGLVRGELDSLDGRWTNAVAVQGVDASRDNFSGGALDGGDNGKRVRYSYESTLRFAANRSRSSRARSTGWENFRTSPVPHAAQSIDRQITNKAWSFSTTRASTTALASA
jgi:vitamin B12 transporter